MNSEDIRKTTFRIGAFRVEPTRNLLKKDGQTFALEPRIMDVLCELASFPAEVIPRFELIKRIWKVDYGADESLTRAISVLRKTFRKGGETEKYIETISKNGYRLIAHVGPWDAPINRIVTAVPDKPPPRPMHAKAPAITANIPVASSATIVPTNAIATKPAIINVRNSLPLFAIMMGVSAVVIAGVYGVNMRAQTRPAPSKVQTLATAGQNTAPAAKTPLGPLEIDTGLVYGNTVAVLSFSDMSLAGDQQYFADGMAEELLSQLSTIPNLQVVSRQASFAFKGQRIDPREIGRKLQVSHIIAGSVRTNGELVRISTQLINAANANQLWSKSYTGRLADGFTIQEQVARDSMRELAFILSEDWVKDVPKNLLTESEHITFKGRDSFPDNFSDNFSDNFNENGFDETVPFDPWGPNGPPK